MKTELGLPKFVTLAWVLWPAILTLILPNATREFFWHAIDQYIYRPPSVRNITSYWLKDSSAWRRIYIELWFLNSIFIALIYIKWMKNNADDLNKIDNGMTFKKLLLLGFTGLVISLTFYSPITFDPRRELTEKLRFLIFNDLGLTILTPSLFIGASCSSIIAFSYLLAAGQRIIKPTKIT
ncbi:hypothetical protein [Hydrogenophaga sp.]|uniref:hypothetical protein n=1 Tax=Hydrogenophaga sp. TaxID=1904254 RepID=UPI002606AAE9|nr:hypothetical protein [Hydrogenophaga sp.]MCW5655729.1 hypothetical protein [Hydrogenophaga sp.]